MSLAYFISLVRMKEKCRDDAQELTLLQVGLPRGSSAQVPLALTIIFRETLPIGCPRLHQNQHLPALPIR
jgi:hypothetical protein